MGKKTRKTRRTRAELAKYLQADVTRPLSIGDSYAYIELFGIKNPSPRQLNRRAMGTLTIGPRNLAVPGEKPDTWITTGTDTRKMAYDMIKGVIAPLHVTFMSRLNPVAKRAVAEWPVKTGRSRSTISLEVSASAVEISAQLDVASQYAKAIARGRVSSRLVEGPFKKAEQQIADAIGDSFVRMRTV